MSEPTNNHGSIADDTGNTGIIFKYGNLPESFKVITPNNVVEMLVVVEQLDTTTKCSDRGPFKVARCTTFSSNLRITQGLTMSASLSCERN